MPPVFDIATLVIDCADAGPLRLMYAALGAVPDERYPGSGSLLLSGLTISFNEVPTYRAPTWPEGERPSHIHLDFFVDSPDEARLHLESFGATTATFQPHLENGLVVMLDPAGHPFCIGTRV